METGVRAGSIPQPVAAELTKDKTLAVVTTTLPGPHQAVLGSIPPSSGPVTAGLDQSGSFSLIVLVERRAREQLNDVALLRTSVEYSVRDSTKKIWMLEKELHAVKGWKFPSAL